MQIAITGGHSQDDTCSGHSGQVGRTRPARDALKAGT